MEHDKADVEKFWTNFAGTFVVSQAFVDWEKGNQVKMIGRFWWVLPTRGPDEKSCPEQTLWTDTKEQTIVNFIEANRSLKMNRNSKGNAYHWDGNQLTKNITQDTASEVVI